MTEIAVVVVNHNGGDAVLKMLASIRSGGQQSAPPGPPSGLRPEAVAEVVVIDNASVDGSSDAIAAAFPWVRMIRNDTNVGFAAAANQGVRATSAPFVALINDDAELRPGALEALAATLEDHPRAAAVGALVRNPDGTVQPTKRSFPGIWEAALHATVGAFWPNNPGTRAYVLADVAFDEARRVDWVAGTAMALRREAFEDVGAFDEAFFFFVEDVDLCKRFADAGYEVWFEPRAEIVHRWGGSWTRRPVRFTFIHHVNVFRFVRKHRRGAWVLAYPFIAAGLAVRFCLLVLRWLVTGRTVPEHRRQA